MDVENVKYTLGDDFFGNPPKVVTEHTQFLGDREVTIPVKCCPGCPGNDPTGFVSILRPSRPPAYDKYD